MKKMYSRVRTRNTMHKKYGDNSNHLCCDRCGFCITCKDCQCKTPKSPPLIDNKKYFTTEGRLKGIASLKKYLNKKYLKLADDIADMVYLSYRGSL